MQSKLKNKNLAIHDHVIVLFVDLYEMSKNDNGGSSRISIFTEIGGFISIKEKVR